MKSDAPPSLNAIVESYGRFVPEQFLKLLDKENITEITLGDHKELTMTVLFSDIRNFTTLSEAMTPDHIFKFINHFFGVMEPLLSQYGGIIDKFIGDAIMALFPSGADSGLQASIAMLQGLQAFNTERQSQHEKPIAIGIGLNTGVTILGTVGGRTRMDSTVISDAVNVASRVEAMTKVYGTPLLISERTFYSLEAIDQYHIRFIDRIRVKGKKQPESVYEVYDADPPEVLAGKNKSRRLFEEGIAHYHLKNIAEAKKLLMHCLDTCQYDQAAQVYLQRCLEFEASGVHRGTGEIDHRLEWDASIEIGHPQIDEQHRQLFTLAADFIKTIKVCTCFSQTSKAIEPLSQAIEAHFRDEENVMKETGYPFFAENKQQHERFSKYFNELKHDIERDLKDKRLYLLFRLQILIVDWLINHTGGIDKHLGKFLRLRKNG